MTDKGRTQESRSATTRLALVAAGRTLFAQRGYQAVGTEELVRAAGLTRGALYHHFTDKADLFAAVFAEVETETNGRIRDAAGAERDPMEAMRLGAATFLDVCADPELARIMLVDAPSVLGWERWTQISNEHNMGLVQALLAEAMARGLVLVQPIPPLAHTVLGALREAALYLARADDREQAHREVGAVVDRLIRSLGDQPVGSAGTGPR